MDNHPGRGAFCPKPREPGTDPTRRRWALSRAPAVLGFVQVTRRLNHGPARQRGRPGRRAFSGHVQAQQRDGVTSPRLLAGSSGLNQQLWTSAGRRRSQGRTAQFPETERRGVCRFSKVTEQMTGGHGSCFQKWPISAPPLQRATRMAKIERTDNLECCQRLEQLECSLAWLVGGGHRYGCVGEAWRSPLKLSPQRLCAGQVPSRMWTRGTRCHQSHVRTRRFRAARSTTARSRNQPNVH